MIPIDTFAPPRAWPGTLVCLHSSASSGRQWRALTAWIDPALHQHAPDLLGYGEDEGWPTGRPVSLAEEAERLDSLLHADPGGVHLLGHSYGGAVALELARRRPTRVRSLTLYEPVRFGLLLSDPSKAAGAEQILGVARRIERLVQSGHQHEAAALFVDYWSGAGTWAALGSRQQDTLARRMPKVKAEFEALFADDVPAADFAALSMPVTLIGGRRSPLPARQVLDCLAALMPLSDIAWIDGAGHMAPLTHPGAVAAHLPRWLLAGQSRQAA